MREISPVEKCNKRKWKKGTILRCEKTDWSTEPFEYWKITALGEHEVLGIRVNLKPFETCGEEIIPFYKRDSWRKSNLKTQQ
jgi:hypothetical protein